MPLPSHADTTTYKLASCYCMNKAEKCALFQARLFRKSMSDKVVGPPGCGTGLTDALCALKRALQRYGFW